MVLAKNCYTPVSYWLSLPLRQLYEWVKANNQLMREEDERWRREKNTKWRSS